MASGVIITRVTAARSDVLVIGGGPAGSAAATLLAKWGHSIRLVTKAASGSPLGESIPPSTAKLFDAIGAGEAMERAGFVRSTGNTVWWGGATPRIETFAGGAQGWQVTSTGLAAVLLEHARDAGVQIERSRVDSTNAAAETATFVLDCTGRAGLIARARGLRHYDERYRTVAIVGAWRQERPFELPDPSHTVIESYEGGWAWSVPRSEHERFVALMVDPRTSELAREVPSTDIYLHQLQRATHVHRMVSEAELIDAPSGWDASMYKADRYVEDNVLLVGDAGSFIDPLSSAGVKKALASGWLAAVAVHTSLKRPEMRQTALAFFDVREREVFDSFRAMTERFFSQAAAEHRHPFWADRLDEAAPSVDERAAAFEQLRTRPLLRVTRSPHVRVEARPAVSGSEIVLEPRLVLDPDDSGVRYAFDVDLIGLIELAPVTDSVPGLFEAYNKRHAPVALPDLLAALSTALARKWLLWL